MLDGIIIYGALVGLIVGSVIVGFALILASMRKGNSLLGNPPGRNQKFVVDCTAEQAFKEIIRFAQKSNYRIIAVDEKNFNLVLEEAASITTWGFFFSIMVSAQSDSTATILIGIKSKLVQVGPIVDRSLERCCSEIRTACILA